MISLSQRELSCLKWAARGKTYNEIGMILGLSFSTVKSYLDSARYKLNCANLPMATARAVAIGVLTQADLEERT